MKRLITRAVEIVQRMARLKISPGDVVIDATCGKGRDTLFLADLIGDAGLVLAFDIQAEACRATAKLLGDAGMERRVRIIQDSHTNMAAYLDHEVGTIIFNLGWLPGSDHRYCSKAEETIIALNRALSILKKGGTVFVTAYPGHDDGAEESAVVRSWASQLSASEAAVMEINFSNKKEAPFIIVIEKN